MWARNSRVARLRMSLRRSASRTVEGGDVPGDATYDIQLVQGAERTQSLAPSDGATRLFGGIAERKQELRGRTPKLRTECRMAAEV